MARTLTLVAVAALAFVSFFIFTRNLARPIVTKPTEAPEKITKTAGEDPSGKYLAAKTWPEYFITVLSDSRLKVDTEVVRILSSRAGKIDYGFLYSDSSIQKGKAFLKSNGTVLARAYKTYGVAPNFTTAVLKLETDLGDLVGDHLAVNALYSICLFSEKRGKSAAKELRAFLEICMKNEWDPFSIRSSWVGAFGISQFMPRSFKVFAVDGNDDGVVDPFNMDDAIAGTGNFLKRHGWRVGDPSTQRTALKSYNRGSYAGAVLKYAALLEEAPKKARFKTPAKR